MYQQIRNQLPTKRLGPNSYHTWRCAVSITELIQTLNCFSHCFYFYNGGLVEAIKVLFSTFQYSKQLNRDYYNNPVIYDYESFLEVMQKHNALPLGHANLWNVIDLATKEIDKAIYLELEQYIGDEVIIIKDIHFIGDTSCILTIER